jgi:uncharacterized protein YjbJ (UPF0337 family)
VINNAATATSPVIKVARMAPGLMAPGLRTARMRKKPTLLVTRQRRSNQNRKKQEGKECVMDWNRIEGNWKQFKGQAKEKWGRLTDDDLDVIKGRQDQLEGKIQERYGLAKDQAKKDVDAWFKSLP